jgi:TRAP-type C4-dicarboxylate transport system substrate-binding protein
LCQYGRLSPDDQREFDKAYTKWVNDSRDNDRDDIDKDVRRMQDIMARNNIPPNVPYEQIASSGYGQDNRYNGAYQQNAPYGYNQGRLSPNDQREFDKAYDKWVNDSRKNDRDDLDKDVRRMQDIMARNNIAPSVPYDQIATPGYNNNYRGYAESRLSPDDQHEFDKAYEKWEKHVRKNDRDDIRKDERKMQDIMARYNIPRNVSYDQVASPEYRHR